MRILLQGGTIINEGRTFKGDLLIHNDRIEKIIEGELDSVPGDIKVIDATGKYIIPGVIDDQVHFREPGLTHKGDIREGSRAAAAGGVTSFMDMPNVKPPTVPTSYSGKNNRLPRKIRLSTTRSTSVLPLTISTRLKRSIRTRLAALKFSWVPPRVICWWIVWRPWKRYLPNPPFLSQPIARIRPR